MVSIGDTVTFKQQYGPGILRHVGGVATYVYRRRRVSGTVRQVIGDSLLIEVEGAPRYSNMVGMPVSKVVRKGK